MLPRTAALFLVALAIVAAPVLAQETSVGALPVRIPDAQFSPLRSQTDRALQRSLRNRLNRNPEWRRLIENDRMAVSLVDITDPAKPRLATVNGDLEMYAASLPKIAVLLAAEQAVEDGLLELTPEVNADLHDMIRVSSNPAATRTIDRVGFDKIEATLRDPRYQLYDPETGGGLWVGKRYAKTGERRGDPLNNISHAATVTQVARFYYMLVTGRLVSEARSRHMLQVLTNPGINHKFVYSLSTRAPRARLFRKSGSWRNWHADSVLVWGAGWRRYILVCLVEDANGERIIRDLIAPVEDLLRPTTGAFMDDSPAADLAR